MKNETGCGLKSGSYVWVGMVVKKSEKLSTGFSDHEWPHLTKYDHIKNNGERKVALLLGELPSSRLYLFYGTYEDFGQTAGLIDLVQFIFR